MGIHAGRKRRRIIRKIVRDLKAMAVKDSGYLK